MKFDYSLPLEGDFALKEKNRSRKTAIFRNVKATDLPLFKSSWSSLSYFKCSWNKFLRLEKFGESSIFFLPLGCLCGGAWYGEGHAQSRLLSFCRLQRMLWSGWRQADARPVTIGLETCWGSWGRCVSRLEHLQGTSYSRGCCGWMTLLWFRVC